MMSCRAAIAQLDLFHDAELQVGEQIALESHLCDCEPCRERVRGLGDVRRVMREGSSRRALRADLLDGLASTVVSRFQAEEAQTMASRVGRMFEDMHLVWAALAGTVAILCCVTALFGLLYLSAPSRSDSLFGLMQVMAERAEPRIAAQLNWRVRLPRVSPDAALPVILGETGSSDREVVFALAAVVNRDGRISDLEVLVADERDGDVLLRLLGAASAAHFEPARVAGAPIAMNLVWLLAHTTVRAGAAPEAALLSVRPFPA